MTLEGAFFGCLLGSDLRLLWRDGGAGGGVKDGWR